MELILINDSKLKIMLTEEDMVRYELDCKSVNYDNTETRRAFWSILDEAKHRTGFDAASDRVFIQLYPSKEGGCEMYVTKVGLLCTSPQSRSGSSDKPDNSADPSCTADGILAFMFTSVGRMIAACRLTTRYGHIVSSTAWVDENGSCYLFTSPGRDSDSSYLCGVMNEYGTTADTDTVSAYIKEHGKELCGTNAVETLAVF